MSPKPTYKELEQKVRELENMNVNYSNGRADIRLSGDQIFDCRIIK